MYEIQYKRYIYNILDALNWINVFSFLKITTETFNNLLRSKLTNDDFRKLLMTPRATPSSAPPSKSRHHEWVRREIHSFLHMCCQNWRRHKWTFSDVSDDFYVLSSQNAEGLQRGWGSCSEEEKEEEVSVYLSQHRDTSSRPAETSC